MNYLNCFPKGEEEVALIKFIAKFQYLRVSDAQYFFNSKCYYRNRVKNLISKGFLKKIKLNLVLDQLGIEYVKFSNFEYNKRNRNQKYLSRLLHLSNLGAFYHDCNTINFIPSFSIKDKNIFTMIARTFIGILNINGFDYLIYQIAKEHDNKYLNTIIYEIQKEKKYKNIIVLINDIKRVNINNFAFGMNQVLVIEDNTTNRESLKYLHSINWAEIIRDNYKNKVFISEYSFCDYTDYKHKYVSTFYFLDAEKINRIKYFLRENKNKNVDIICSSQLENKIKKELPTARYIIVDLEEYIDKERFIYD